MADQRIKVLHIITRLVRGGAQRIVLDLLKRLPRDEFDVVLAAGEQTGDEGSLWPEAEQLGVTLVRIPSLVREISPFKDIRAYGELRRAVRTHHPVIVHAHTSKAGLLGCMAAKKEGVPSVILAPHGHILAEGAQIPGVPVRGWKRTLLAMAAKHNARYADVIVAPNQAELDDGIAHDLWTSDHCFVVPNGVDTTRFRPGDSTKARTRMGLNAASPIIGVIARLTREKGVDIAIEALAKLEGVQGVVIGDGPERKALEALVSAYNMATRVRFLGARDDVHELLPAFDAVLVPSRTEAHGLVAAEALACEIPVVAVAIGGLKSLIIHEQTGLAVSPGPNAAAELATALRRLIADKTLARSLALTGRQHIFENFSLDVMAEKTVDLYRRLASSSSVGKSHSMGKPMMLE
ncbi:MAG: glycosyltransferase [Planctomycetes bacterium]|nr:glycosyltransferase [Planctomycetota bacterium]NUQ35508.1 glycosyltransferase [Planctomycetaceae bacterium]